MNLLVNLPRELADNVATRPVFAHKVPTSRPTQPAPTTHSCRVLPNQLREVASLLAEARTAIVVVLRFLGPFSE